MKTTTLLSAAATALAAMAILASCSTNDDPRPADTRTAVLFTGGIGSVQTSPDTPTRAAGTTWGSGDAIGIFMLSHGTPDLAPDADANRQFITTGTDRFGPAPGNDLYYPRDGSPVDFIAYYPYHPDATLTGTLDVSTADQSRQAGFDLLWASAARAGSGYDKSTATAVPLAFAHRLARLTLHCRADADNTTLPDLDGMVVTIRGMYTAATFSPPRDGAIGTATRKADFIANNAVTADVSATADAIILPATYADGDVSVDFTVHGATYTWHMDATTFAPGCEYTYRVLLTLTGARITGCTITDWTVQEKIGEELH